jgi:hypothetical protein
MHKRLSVICAALALAGFTGAASAVNFPITEQQRSTANQVAQMGVPISDLAPNAPDQYTVKRGDTLWAISGIFLTSPWKWPELWGMNKDQIRNPHLIFPGQVLYLIKKDGRATLSMTAPDGTERLSPRVRAEGLDKAITTIPASVIEPFLAQPLIVERDRLDSAPRILAGRETGRVFFAAGDTAYVRGIKDESISRYQVFRPARPLKDPQTGEVLAYEAYYLGDADLVRSGDPATIKIAKVKEEFGIDDRLLPFASTPSVNFAPRAPERDVNARVASVYSREAITAGSLMVVAINKGRDAGLEPGHTLQVWESGDTVADRTQRAEGFAGKYLGRPQAVKLPDERVGVGMVFRVFDRVSYVLIMSSDRPIRIGDQLRTP